MATEAEKLMENLCRVSMCSPVVETDVEYEMENSPLLNGIGNCDKFVIEFGTENVSVKVSPGDLIDQNTIIAEMENIPVYSKVKGKITEVHEKYIVGEYDLSIVDDLNGKSEDELVEYFEDYINKAMSDYGVNVGGYSMDDIKKMKK